MLVKLAIANLLFLFPPEASPSPDLRVEARLGPHAQLAQWSSVGKTELARPSMERRIALEMRDKPWLGEHGVLEWLSDQTGLPISVSSAKPSGTLTFVSPHAAGVPRSYTLPEIIDILNDELLKQKLILVRRARRFTIEPADERINPAVLPQVLPQQLDQYGNTEIVSVIFSLHSLLAEDFAAEVKALLGPFGAVTALAQANKLIVQDSVANLKRIRTIIEDNSHPESSGRSSLAYPCRYIPARQAERILRDLLGDPGELLRAVQPALQVSEGFAEPSGPLPTVTLPPALLRRHYLSVEDRSNTILAAGPADKIAQAEALLKKLDVPQHPGQQPLPIGPAVLRTYPVTGGQAEALAKSLREIYKENPSVRIAAVHKHALMVWAGPSEQREIRAHVQSARPPERLLEVMPLTVLDAADVVDSLKGLASDEKKGGPYLKADRARNAVIAKGTPEQLRELKFTLRALGEGSPPPPIESVRVLTIEQGATATRSIAEELERMLPQFLRNPIEVGPLPDPGQPRPESR